MGTFALCVIGFLAGAIVALCFVAVVFASILEQEDEQGECP